jgi:hypothetical protein
VKDFPPISMSDGITGGIKNENQCNKQNENLAGK